MRGLVTIGLFSAVLGICLTATTNGSATEITLNGHIFTLPAGFEIEQVAGPPLVNRPITAAFDEKGRLYVADSSGSNDDVDKQVVDRPHRILRLEDTDGDGRFDRKTVYADKMSFPEGTMWLDGSLYVSAPPTIWKLTDTDGDGVADRRVEWITKTLTHCANDLHGPYLGPDGWIYWCKGAFAKQTYARPGKKPFVTQAAHIFRARPDGSRIEPVMTGGMDNPVDVVFTPGGERIFSTTFLVHPHDGNRDGLIHAIYGGVYGKSHGVIDGHKRTGELMPPLVHLGPAAACGLTRYESSVFGPEFKDNVFTCCFNMHKLTRTQLTPRGASFDAKTEDFLVSNNLDFHPTDVLEDADGSLVVVNTGGWYKLCCPTSQLWKPDILGAIYRVRRKGVTIGDPRVLTLTWENQPSASLVELLGDTRPAMRDRAMLLLSKRGDAVDALRRASQHFDRHVRRNAVWTLARIDSPAARQAVRAALGDREETVRQAALHAVSLWRDAAALPQLISLLGGPSAHNARAAAEAIGRIGDKSAVPALLAAAGRLEKDDPKRTPESTFVAGDRIFEHSLIFALIEIDDPAATHAGLASDRPWTRRVALVALDQMDGGRLEAEQVAALLASPDQPLRETASWIIAHHPEWGGALAGSLRVRLHAKLVQADRAELERHLAEFASNGSVQQLLADALSDGRLDPAARSTALHAMRGSHLKELPQDWIAPLLKTLVDKNRSLTGEAVATVRAVPIPKNRESDVVKALLDVAKTVTAPDFVRLDALAAVPGGIVQVDPKTFDFLVAHLDTELPVTTRAAAADVLSKAHLTGDQLRRLTEVFRAAGPLEADRLLAAYERCADEAIGLKLISALKACPALTGLRVDSISERIAKQPPSVKRKAEELYALINVDLAQQRKQIEEVLPLVKHGDIRRGQLVFARQKVACSSCHEFGYVGGHIGPDLTRIGKIRSERDLLEAIMFPSASFVRSFEPMLVVLKSGRVHSGLIKKDAADEIELVTTATETLRIARENIEELRPSRVSVMPAGLDKQLTPAELADLVAFLKNAR